mmetsp:Transcript_12181/g.20533  ORF Transcript_12181/g.20533 Transcript_12181/m.20533 type:complete len:186 (-) Transcript_12181:655-1212(-)
MDGCALPDSSKAEEEMVDQLITSRLEHGKVMMWSLGEDCAHTGAKTRKIKQLLSSHSIEFHEENINDLSPERGAMMKLALSLDSGYSQFPNLYFGQEHLGGMDDLVGYLRSQNTFERLMNKNGIQPSTSTEVSATDEEEVSTPASKAASAISLGRANIGSFPAMEKDESPLGAPAYFQGTFSAAI